jgi:hypothetical protein
MRFKKDSDKAIQETIPYQAGNLPLSVSRLGIIIRTTKKEAP